MVIWHFRELRGRIYFWRRGDRRGRWKIYQMAHYSKFFSHHRFRHKGGSRVKRSQAPSPRSRGCCTRSRRRRRLSNGSDIMSSEWSRLKNCLIRVYVFLSTLRNRAYGVIALLQAETSTEHILMRTRCSRGIHGIANGLLRGSLLLCCPYQRSSGGTETNDAQFSYVIRAHKSGC